MPETSKKFAVVSDEIIYQDQYRTFKKLNITRDGVPGIYTCTVGKKVVIVVPLSPTGRTVMLRQYRFTIGHDKWELCAGTLDPGEDTLTAAKRELWEETGLKVDELIELGGGYLSSGDSDTFATIFLAPTTDAALDQLKTPENMDEILELKTISLDEMDGMAARGELTCGLAFSALYHLHRYLRQMKDNHG